MQLISETLTDADLEVIYKYVDAAPLTKAKKNISRDFSDCSQAAILIKHYLPAGYKSLIQPHNFIETNKRTEKVDNWFRLDKKVLVKLVGDESRLRLNDA